MIINSLPIIRAGYIVRLWERADLDRRGQWPSYSPPYETFNFTECQSSPERLDALFASREADPSRLTLTADGPGWKTIGHFGLQEIDWGQGRIGNLGVRLHPDWCGKGVGTVLLSGIAKWCFGQGFITLSLDVARDNYQAIRCYEKVGFIPIGERERDGNGFFLMELSRN